MRTNLSHFHPWGEKPVPRKMKENPYLNVVLRSRDQKSPNSVINKWSHNICIPPVFLWNDAPMQTYETWEKTKTENRGQKVMRTSRTTHQILTVRSTFKDEAREQQLNRFLMTEWAWIQLDLSTEKLASQKACSVLPDPVSGQAESSCKSNLANVSNNQPETFIKNARRMGVH